MHSPTSNILDAAPEISWSSSLHPWKRSAIECSESCFTIVNLIVVCIYCLLFSVLASWNVRTRGSMAIDPWVTLKDVKIAPYLSSYSMILSLSSYSMILYCTVFVIVQHDSASYRLAQALIAGYVLLAEQALHQLIIHLHYSFAVFIWANQLFYAAVHLNCPSCISPIGLRNDSHRCPELSQHSNDRGTGFWQLSAQIGKQILHCPYVSSANFVLKSR